MKIGTHLRFSFACFALICGCSGVDDSRESGTESTSEALFAPGARMQIYHVASTRVLDSNSAGAVYTSPNNNGAYQKWDSSQGTYGVKYRDVATGRCLDSNTNGNVYTLGCNGGSFQEWVATPAITGSVLRNVATGRYLYYDSSVGVVTSGPSGYYANQWISNTNIQP